MVWDDVASDVNKFRLVFIDEGFKVKSQVYLSVMQIRVPPWLKETFENK